ncbi:MAG: ATP synthase subunit I [Bacteroidetes bacterium]|nr:ATP synthase subunit I [Bacteroidota bacterium]
MNEIIPIILRAGIGFVLGAVFFGGLWLTVKKGLHSGMPGLVFILSFLLRTGVTLTGFYFAAAGNWKYMLACLAGFILARIIIRRYTGPISTMGLTTKKGAS